MDSVSKDTPKTLKENENTKTLRVDEFIEEENWYKNDNILTKWGFNEFGDCNNLKVGTSVVGKLLNQLLDIKLKTYLQNKSKTCYSRFY